MRIYSHSFFHYTRDLATVKGILFNGFKVFFCKEEIYSDKYPGACIGIPMTSFCDIPLSYIADINYGKCGIGMSRSWGIAHSLQPVFYYPNNKSCQSTQMIIAATDVFYTNPADTESYRILGYAKPLVKISKVPDQNDNNYIEREWRKVYASHGSQKWKNSVEYDRYRGPKASPKKVVGAPLKFDANDVDFIIIERKDLKALINYIMHGAIAYVGGKENVPITQDDREILLSKIITYENLIENI